MAVQDMMISYDGYKHTDNIRRKNPYYGEVITTDKKFLCVMAGYDDKTGMILSSLQNKLFENGYTGTQTTDLPQHISLGTFNVETEAKLIGRLHKVAENTTSFDITFNHIDIFGGSKVLFVAPDITRYLLELKENFGDSFNWTPHTTMLIDEPDIIFSALPIITSHFRKFQGIVENIYLYEFWPARFICSEKFKHIR